ncbi:hypothetical protein NPIL_212841 [Nephila pilipes]|uniref:Uncharacterized protein n=1 Tax=Nephila pilipes TaxID=299642 RepID=A0A8X6UI00_NEPPI|nr:hypothetical protein NPIL_212841 [Nephila pilipes]
MEFSFFVHERERRLIIARYLIMSKLFKDHLGQDVIAEKVDDFLLVDVELKETTNTVYHRRLSKHQMRTIIAANVELYSNSNEMRRKMYGQRMRYHVEKKRKFPNRYVELMLFIIEGPQ